MIYHEKKHINSNYGIEHIFWSGSRFEYLSEPKTEKNLRIGYCISN